MMDEWIECRDVLPVTKVAVMIRGFIHSDPYRECLASLSSDESGLLNKDYKEAPYFIISEGELESQYVVPHEWRKLRENEIPFVMTRDEIDHLIGRAEKTLGK